MTLALPQATLLAYLVTMLNAGLPSDPFQRTAVRALRGDFGQLSDWQRAGYEAGIRAGTRATRTIWLTGYYATEGSSGRTDCQGRRCTLRTAAANRVPQGWYVWTEYGIRQVTDRGAKSNDRYAARKGADLWVDYWYPRASACPFGGSTITYAAVIAP